LVIGPPSPDPRWPILIIPLELPEAPLLPLPPESPEYRRCTLGPWLPEASLPPTSEAEPETRLLRSSSSSMRLASFMWSRTS